MHAHMYTHCLTKEGQVQGLTREGQVQGLTREGQVQGLTREGQVQGLTREGQGSRVDQGGPAQGLTDIIAAQVVHSCVWMCVQVDGWIGGTDRLR